LVLPFWQLRRPYPIQGEAWTARPELCGPRPEKDVLLFRDTGMLAAPVAAAGHVSASPISSPWQQITALGQRLDRLQASHAGPLTIRLIG
jgi:hypothetical protein